MKSSVVVVAGVAAKRVVGSAVSGLGAEVVERAVEEEVVEVLGRALCGT